MDGYADDLAAVIEALGLKNSYDSIKAFSETDFTEDLKKFDVLAESLALSKRRPDVRRGDGRFRWDGYCRSRIQCVAFAGSLRRASYNRALLRAATELAPSAL